MENETTGRRLLPQVPPMQQTFYSPPGAVPQENKKNYVFVDEHNRHKRLKVMRACEGCRRRKIKCDAATTNTWPCAACVRLKLNCVPPTVNFEREQDQEKLAFNMEGNSGFDSSGSGEDDYLMVQNPFPESHQADHKIASGHYSDHSLDMYNSSLYAPPAQNQGGMPLPYTDYSNNAMGTATTYPPQVTYSPPPVQGQQAAATPESWHSEQYPSSDISDALGGLKIDETGIAPYISDQKKSAAPWPPVENFDEFIRSVSMSAPDGTLRIPPELMPSDDQAMMYFDIYFRDIHPYVPVIYKTTFYSQWHHDRNSISPLIIEAMFACVGSLAEDRTIGQKWLALATKHAEHYMDIPQLCTIQALLLMLKARECSPKRGYYFSSWMTVVRLVAMAKDLGLHQHYDVHQAGETCDSSSADECATKTRIWQTLLVVELMIGAPQGRFPDMSVDPETVDFSITQSLGTTDPWESHVSRGWTYMSRIIRNVRRMNDIYFKLKKTNKKDWGADPQFVQLNPSFLAWHKDLPLEFQVTFPSDGSLPYLPSHFVGNLHSYYHLSILMLHRPQLLSYESYGADGAWKYEFLTCYSAAKNLCRLQEAILARFGLPGLLCMQRGIGFTVYAVLTCAAMHLAAITSPDPELNSDARSFFTRHMRILEQCTKSWPMPDMQAQIDSLREAFSADVNKPFELKASFPFNSPAPMPAQISPGHARQFSSSPGHQQPMGSSHGHHHSLSNPQLNHQHTLSNPHSGYGSHPLSPPVSAGLSEGQRDSSAGQSLLTLATGPSQPQNTSGDALPMMNQVTWNPSRIFESWNSAFGVPQASVSPPTPVRLTHPDTTTATRDSQHIHDTMQNAFSSIPSAAGPALAQQPTSMVNNTSIQPTFVSPSMWQSSVQQVMMNEANNRRY